MGERVADYRARLLQEIEGLSEERIRALADFAAYLREREEWEATAEILANEELAEEVRRSRQEWAASAEGFVPLADLKANLNA